MSDISILVRNAQCSALSDLADGGYVQLRSGTQPANAESAATGTLLATITLNTPAFATPSNGSMELDTPAAPAVVANGTLTWARFFTSSNQTIMDRSVSLSGGGGQLIATKTALVIDDTVGITYTHTVP